MTNADATSYDRNRVVDLEHRARARMVLRWLIIQARRRTSRTTGTVVRVEIRGSPFTWGPPFIWEPSPDIEFVDGQGNKHLCKSSYWTTWNQWPVGSQVDVTCDPHDLRIVNLNCPEA